MAEEKKLKAKTSSLIGQIIAAIWIAGYGSFYIFKNIERIEVWSIIFLGLAIAACFTPVYFSLFLDKFLNRVPGNKLEEIKEEETVNSEK